MPFFREKYLPFTILYVAMTRAIRKLICIVPDAKNENTWASLIEEVGVYYE